ncbi:recombinase family protein [Streptomyces sp. NBC_01429]|uniref:recombinase family protein n=1 Tax=Streptomyces sp. NBC_01429 TaxID=2903862 RepID=UPI002E2DD6E5|nr:recombinase family protein [Streptomyces sp. NBC_01429]
MSRTLELHDAGGTAEQFLADQRVAAGYTRQSKAKADKSEASPRAQDEATERKALERGCSFKGYYRDIGVSGYDPNAERKGFDRLMRDCRDGLIQEIVVFDVTRFSRREPKDMIPVVLELFSLGVTITSVAEGPFTPDKPTELMMLIRRLQAAYQSSENKSETASGAKRAAGRFGGWTGGTPPYGMESYAEQATRVIDGKPVTITTRFLRPTPKSDDGTDQGGVVVSMVDRIFEHKDKPWDGKKNAHPGSVNSLTTWLNQRRIKTQQGGLWRTPTVKRVLSDPRLAGFAAKTVYRTGADGRPTRTVDGYRILRDEHGDPLVIGEALIPPARWFELQEWLSGRGRGKGLTRGEYLLTAMERLECECGRPMTGSPRIYKCCRPSGVVEPGQHEGGNSISQDALDDHVARRVLEVILGASDSPETRDIITEATLRYAEFSEDPSIRGERASLVSARAVVTRSMERLYDDLNSGIYDGPVGRARFRDEKEQLEILLESLGRRLVEVGCPELPALPLEEWGDAGHEDPIGQESWWGRATVAERRTLVKLFVDKIVVTKATYRGGTARACRAEERVTVTMASAGPTSEGNGA